VTPLACYRSAHESVVKLLVEQGLGPNLAALLQHKSLRATQKGAWLAECPWLLHVELNNCSRAFIIVDQWSALGRQARARPKSLPGPAYRAQARGSLVRTTVVDALDECDETSGVPTDLVNQLRRLLLCTSLTVSSRDFRTFNMSSLHFPLPRDPCR
jgi:hypothetical protein